MVHRRVVVAEGHADGLGPEIRPVEEECDGLLVEDVETTQHEFDNLKDAVAFAAAQLDPDKNPVETTVFVFEEDRWVIVRV